MAEAGAGAGAAGTEDAGAAGTAGAAGAAGAGAGAAPWHGLSDPESVAYVQNKGWQSPADVIKSYTGAEKLIGRDPNTLLVLPRADDPAGLRSVYAKLGMPETADKYDIPVPEGTDPGFVNWAKETYHKAGLTSQQVKDLTAAHNAYVAEQATKIETDYKATIAAEKQALLNEWKGGHERMMNIAQTAAKTLGFTGEMIDAMEQAIGYAGTMKFFADLGKRMSEDTFVSGDTKNQRFEGTMTPEEAKQQWETMKLDPNYMAALRDKSHPGHAEAQRKQTNLFKIAFPENQ